MSIGPSKTPLQTRIEQAQEDALKRILELQHWEDNLLNKPLTSCEFVGMHFKDSFNTVQRYVFRIAQEKGWWKDGINSGEKIALMHSELSEALEALRYPALQKSEKIPDYWEVEEELADTIIRIMDFAEKLGFDIAGAILAKASYNTTRPHKHGGKRF